MSRLPDHIIKELLCKVPFTTFLKCRSVSKSWRDVLSEPGFSNLRESTTVVLCQKEKSLHWLEFEGMESRYYKPAAKPVDLRFQFQTVSSCNGLFCVREYKTSTIYDRIMMGRSSLLHVLNPITGEYMTLPDCEKPEWFKEGSWGLGFCPKTNQFKVVKAFYLSHCGNDQRTDLHGMVYTIGTGTWRSIRAVGEFCDTRWPNRFDSAFVNGPLHWLVKNVLENLTCTFNFETEQFGSFPLPPDAGNVFQ